MESGNKYDDDSTLSPLISDAEMNVVSSGGESGAEPMPMDMLEDICDISKSHQSINRIEVYYKIPDCVKQI